MPVPDDVENPNFRTATGNVSYVPEKNSLRWSIKQFAGHKYLCIYSGSSC